MLKLMKHFTIVIFLIVLILSSSITNITSAFSPAKNLKSSSQSREQDFYNSEEATRQKPLDHRPNFWVLDAFKKTENSVEVEKYKDAFAIDQDSVELIVGVNLKQRAYGSLLNEVYSHKGNIINKVVIEGNIIALVVDMPLDYASTFTENVWINGLARYVEPNMKVQTYLTPNDPNWNLQWGPQKIQADWAWNTTIGDSTVIVAVIDTGIDYTHPDLAENYVPLGYDWVNMDEDPLDDNGHGTHCAGIIGAVLNNAEGIAGIAQVKIMAEKGLDAGGMGWDDDLANAIIHAVDQGADILSNSWGGYLDSFLIRDAVEYAYKNDVLVIAAAGNNAANKKSYPAAYKEVVAVTATDSDDNPASFTNFGDWVEVAAPGVDIYSTLPTYHVTLNDYGYAMYYDSLSGTSMACPHVSGVAALILSQFPNASRDWVRAQLRFTADDLGATGFDEYYGYGRINAKNAVQQAPATHDLIIFDYKKPRYIQPGEIVLLNVTMLNFGANDEDDVSVQLLINSTLTDLQVISHFESQSSLSISLMWNPLEERVYNVTFYVVPVLGETETEDNVLSMDVSVRHVVGYILFDQTHYCDPIDMYTIWIENLTSKGYVVDTLDIGVITPEKMMNYQILVIAQPWLSYSADEVIAIQDFVINGGGLLVIGDDYPMFYSNLTSFVGIDWMSESHGWYGETNNIVLHEVTEGVDSAYFDMPMSRLLVSSPAIDLIKDDIGYGEILLAVSEFGAGRVIALADEQTIDNYDISSADNSVLANNMIDWLTGKKYLHELVVGLEVPSYLMPGENSRLNATVYNRGLSDETDVQLQLMINGTVVSDVTIPEIANGTKSTISYLWNPTEVATYNITAYALPVPDENVTINNMKTRIVSVQYPLINPVEGQYANYTINIYDEYGYLTSTMQWNFTYDHYVEPYIIYVTVQLKDQYGYEGSAWMTVNTMTRYVESGAWAGLWYPGWIETNIDVGSTLNLLDGSVRVNGSKVLTIPPRMIDCWEISTFNGWLQYFYWYDKASGLWMRMEGSDTYGNRIELFLTDTNVPIGTKYEHDLGISLIVPRRPQPDKASAIVANVYNLGLNNETNIQIQLLINSTLADYVEVPQLINGTYYSLNYSWTPISEGIYNITAYVLPVPNENVTANNAASQTVHVLYVKVAMISDYNELTIIAPILDSIPIEYDIYNYNSLNLYTENLTLLLKYEVIIFYNTYRAITPNEYSTLQSYLAYGRNLLVTGLNSLGNPNDSLLADIVHSTTVGDNFDEPDLLVVDESHPIMNGPYGNFPRGYHVYLLSSDCDLAEADVESNAVTVAELADGYDKIIATDGLPGKVVYWNGNGALDLILSSDCKAMFKNLMYWFVAKYAHELVVFLEAPKFLEPDDSAILNATVQNQGVSNETYVKLQIVINGTIIDDAVISQLSSGELYVLSYVWTPITAATYNITVYAPPITGENRTRNNIVSRLVLVRHAPRILAYVEYTDYNEEYANTLVAINSAFGCNYILTELWNYTQLSSKLFDNDILLIPEQEHASINLTEAIGTSWAETLQDFLDKGGIIIVCDYNEGWGGTYGILTGAGLMSIAGANYRTMFELYVADPEDPLAKGVPASFSAPSGTVSFITKEQNAVVNDGAYPVAYPVVINKRSGRGRIVLLGFDFYWQDPNTSQLLGNAIALAPVEPITISLNPFAGLPGTNVYVIGARATPDEIVSIYWNDIFIGNTTADISGNFSYILTVPSYVEAGIYNITAEDVATGRIATASFRVFLVMLNPSSGPVGTKVTVAGGGFTPKSEVKITFNDMLIGYALTDDFGHFVFVFNVPTSTAGLQTVKVFGVEGEYVYATFTVVDVTPLEVGVDVGALHFIGEIAEFYVQTTFKGQAVNASITSIMLYKPDGNSKNLTAQLLSTGLYKISYTITGDEIGTYTLTVSAEYVNSTVQAFGASFKCFLVSDTLSLMNSYILEIKNGVAYIKADIGSVRLNLTAMNATLETIFLKVLTINGTIATLQTTIGIVNGTIESINGNIATIVVPGIGQIQTDISEMILKEDTSVVPIYVTLIFVLAAAIGSIASLALLLHKKKSKVEPLPSPIQHGGESTQPHSTT